MLGLLVGAAVASKMIDVISESAKTRSKAKIIRDGLVIVNSDSAGFAERNYLDVIRDLQGMGFTNITAKEIRKHRKGLFNSSLYGKVESVTINGENSFSKGKAFAPGVHVLVAFHVFKDSPPVDIPDLRRNPVEHRQQPEQQPYQQPVNVNVNIQQPYGQSVPPFNPYGEDNIQWFRCSYCGSMIPNSKGFCPRCGGPL